MQVETHTMGRIANAWAALKGKGAPAETHGTVLWRVSPRGESAQRGTRELLQAYSESPWLAAVVRKIAFAVAANGWEVYNGKPEALKTHPLLELLDNPNPKLSGIAARQLTQTWWELTGEAFWILERNAAGEPVQYWPTSPHCVQETPSRTFPYYRCRLGDTQWNVPEADMIWFRDPDPVNPYGRGTGIARSLSDEIDTYEYATKHAKGYFTNGALPDHLILLPGAGADVTAAFKAKWLEEHSGFGRAGTPAFIGGPKDGKPVVERLDTSFRNMQLVELTKHERDTIIQVWGVPPEEFGIIENSNRSTIESADFLMAKNIILPRLIGWKSILQTKLLPQFKRSERDRVEYMNPVPEDREFKLKVMSAQPRVFRGNEFRQLAGAEPDEEQEDFVQAAPAFAPAGELGRDPEWVRELRRLGPRRAAPLAVENVLEMLRAERLTSEVEPLFAERMEKWARKVLKELGAEGRFDILNPLIPRYLEELSGTKIKGVNDTTRDALRDTLTEGVRAGESIADLKKRVRDVFDIADSSRAEAIARTEVVGASNWATHGAYKASGVVEKRAWVATRDERTRESHAELDGQEQPLGKRFTVNGKSADYPGGFGDPAEDIQCRCTVVAVIDDPDDGDRARGETAALDLDATWRAFDGAIRPWESEARQALRLGFRAQLADVLEALEAST